MGDRPVVSVRAVAAEDRPAWQRLWEGYLRFYRAELDGPTTNLTFERLCDERDEAFVGLLAVNAEGEAAGLAHLVFHPSTWSQKSVCYLEDLYVDRSRRGAGVAETLFVAIYELARRRDAERVYWHTQQFNGAARSLYDTVGRLTSFVVYEHELR